MTAIETLRVPEATFCGANYTALFYFKAAPADETLESVSLRRDNADQPIESHRKCVEQFVSSQYGPAVRSRRSDSGEVRIYLRNGTWVIAELPHKSKSPVLTFESAY